MHNKLYPGKFLLFLTVVFLCGCFPPTPGITTLSGAHKKFAELCNNKENNLDVKVMPLKQTLYIYLPIEHAIHDFRAKPKFPEPQSAPEPKETRAVNYLKAAFSDGTFILGYDITPTRTYAKDLGYQTIYDEAFLKKKNKLLQALLQAYGDLGEVPGDRDFAGSERDITRDKFVEAHIKTEPAPDFIVLIIADIRKGLESRELFHFKDFKRAMTGTMSQDEYAKRYINEGVTGSLAIINDKEGKHLQPVDITWKDFLA